MRAREAFKDARLARLRGLADGAEAGAAWFASHAVHAPGAEARVFRFVHRMAVKAFIKGTTFRRVVDYARGYRDGYFSSAIATTWNGKTRDQASATLVDVG